MEAVAIQPDGTRALITNIDPVDEERARFWSLVEKHEAVASKDKMTLRVSDRPAFWAAVSGQADCPAELKQALGTNSPDEPIKFVIPSGKAMRAFLDKQPGWVKPTKANTASGVTPFASFHDGRKDASSIVSSANCLMNSGLRAVSQFFRDFAAILNSARCPSSP